MPLVGGWLVLEDPKDASVMRFSLLVFYFLGFFSGRYWMGQGSVSVQRKEHQGNYNTGRIFYRCLISIRKQSEFQPTGWCHLDTCVHVFVSKYGSVHDLCTRAI